MDVRREGVVEARRRKQFILGTIGVILLALVTVAVMRLEPAAPKVDRATIYTDTVKQGEMLRQVRGPGTLVPLEIRWIAARTEGRVEQRVMLPGAVVEPDTVIVVLSNPELEQMTQDSALALRRAEAEYADRQVALESQLLNEKAAFAAIESEYEQASLQAEANATLLTEGLIPELTEKLSRLRADQLENRTQIEVERLEFSKESVKKQLESQRAALDQARALHQLRLSQFEGLQVKAGITGVLQQVPVEVGQQVTPGTNLARVAQPDRLKAELRINETQAKDIVHGQLAMIDTRNGVVEGKVIRIDPAVQNGTVTVDVALVGELPRGARPDLSVDGTIEIERLDDVLYVGRPTYGQANSTIGLFKIDETGEMAHRIQVQLGKTSVTTVEILNGLRVGDEVILSDTSNWDEYDRIRLD